MIRRNGRERIENILRKQIVFKREGVLKRRKMADSGDEPSSSHDSPPSNDGENSPSPPPPTPTTPPPASEDKPSNSPPPSSSSPPPSQKSSPPPSPSESSPPHSNTPPPSASPSPSPSPSPPPPVSPPPSSPPPSNSPPSGSESSKAPPPSKSDSSPPPPSNSDSSPPPPQKSSPEPPPESPPPSPPPPTPPPQPSPPPPPSPTPPSGSPPPGKSTPPPPPPPPVTPPPAPASSNNTTLPVPGGSVPLPPPRARLPSPPPPPVAIDSPEESSHDVPGVLSPPSTSSRSNTNTTSSDSSGSSGTSTTIIGVSVAGVIFISLVALVFLFLRRRKKKQDEVFAAQYRPPNSFSLKSGSSQNPQSPNGIGNVYQPGGPDSGLGSTKSWFSYEELMEITNGFSRENILGEGGFGCVYKGWLPDGRIVAVKQLKAGSGQGEREFRAEVEIISRVHHRHLVSLVGFCIAEHHRLLIYEFVPNKTLEHHLHGNGLPVLDWTKRIKIALGSARGLAYLHEDCHPKIIHRDIKSANILLDDAFEAQVADFGLAKLANDTNTHVSTRVMGTFGYMAPEYASSGKLTDRSDVFSFGVVLLELVTGRKPVDASQPLGDESLVEWARPLLLRALETGDFSEVVDPRLEKKYVESEMFRMIEAAAACVRHSAPKRPRMVQVVRALDSEGEMSDLSNGVKYGQSTVYESGQYNHDISRFRRMAFGSGESSNFDMFSGEYDSREYGPPSSSEFPSSGSETQAINAHSGEHRSERRF